MDKNNNNIIYFYFCDNGKYIYQFLIQFYEEKIACKEIEKIKQRGIGKYIIESGNDFSVIKNSDLIDDDLNNIGIFINNYRINKNEIWYPFYSNNLKYFEYSEYFTGVLLCLMNLESFKKYFLNKNNLINIKEDSIYTKYFFKIANDLWNIQDKEQNKELYINFFEEIKNAYGSEYIFSDIKLLIDFLLIKLIEEQKVDIKNERIKNMDSKLYERYTNRELLKINFYKNKSLIEQLFIFDFELRTECQKCGRKSLEYSITFSLDMDIEQSYDKINIYTILDNINKVDTDCECGNSIYSYRNINFCPLYLIIIIRNQKNYNFKFEIEEDIDIKNYVSNKFETNTNYELVALIKNIFTTICKSSKDNIWYKYDSKNKNYGINKKFKFQNQNEDFIPCLLIYKNKNKN